MNKSSSPLRRRSQLSELRDLVPCRPLRFGEACALAERQATKLLATLDRDEPPVPISVVTDLPRIDVTVVPSMTRSGISQWSWQSGAYRIHVNGAEPRTRNRFTIAHELKHCLDARDEAVLFSRLGKDSDKHAAVEAICDSFAASLLMPRRWVKRAWFAGRQDVAELAWFFEVSPQAMRYRLHQLGLLEPLPRCAGPRTKARRDPNSSTQSSPLGATP